MPNTNKELSAKLKGFRIFSDISDDELTNLCEGVTFSVIAADTVLFQADASVDACYFVTFGSVKLVRQVDTAPEVIMTFRSAGHFIAAAVAVLTDTPLYPATAIAMEDTGIVRIPTTVFNEGWRKNPKIADAIRVTLHERFQEYHDDKSLATSPVKVRIARFLLRTLDQQSPDCGCTLMIRLSRKDIADRVGTTVETVIRILSDWTKRGWIATHDRRITILARGELSNLRRPE